MQWQLGRLENGVDPAHLGDAFPRSPRARRDLGERAAERLLPFVRCLPPASLEALVHLRNVEFLDEPDLGQLHAVSRRDGNLEGVGRGRLWTRARTAAVATVATSPILPSARIACVLPRSTLFLAAPQAL